MPDRQDTQEPWKKAPYLGSLYEKPSAVDDLGREVIEKFNAFFGFKTITHKHADAERTLAIPQPYPHDEEDKKILQKLMVDRNRHVTFLSRKEKVLCKMHLPEGQHIGVNLKMTNGKDLYDFLIDNEPTVSLRYGDDKLLQATLDVESASSLNKPINYQNWKESLVDLVGYIEAIDEEIWADEKEEASGELSFKIENLMKDIETGKVPKEAVSLVSRLPQVAAKFIKKSCEAYPLENKEDVKRSLETSFFPEFTMMEVLDLCIKKGQFDLDGLIKDYGENELLTNIIQDNIEFNPLTRDQNLYPARELLEIDSLTEQGFQMKNIEEEQDKITSGVKRVVKQENSARYNEEIIVMNKIFKITREGNVITTTCSSYPKRKELWIAKIPLEIPAEKIKEIFLDTQADFRQIKELFSGSLQMS